MATATKTCGVCELRHINKPSVVWCSECDEGLCTECKEHHSLSKASRRHCVIPFTEYQKLPADILKITQYCNKHDKKYQIYCQKHEFPCCSKCIVESHTECRDFVELDDVIHNVKTSNAMCELEETLVEVAVNIQKIRQNQEDNLTKFNESKKGIETEIKKTRIKINNHLDKLQDDLMEQLYVEEEKENSKISQLLSSLEKKEKEIAECQRNIVNIKQHATDLQVFLSMKKIQQDVNGNIQFMQSLEADKNFKQISLSFKINNSIKNITSDIISFGDVRIEAKSCDTVITRKKDKQAQMMVPTVQSRPIENITLTKQNTINTKRNSIFGCCMFPDGKMAFTNHSDSTVTVFNMKGLKDLEMKMPFNPFDLVFISEDNTLAVTSGYSQKKCITIIDLEKKQIKKTISLDSNSYGIALKDNRLVYCDKKGLRMINMYDVSITDIVRDKIPGECKIATFRDNIYYTNTKIHTVTCYNLQGEIQWIFQNESVLNYPLGIDVDSEGNVYVAGYVSNNVIVITSDGQRHREVLTTSNGLSYPVSLHYSGPTNQLLVANCRNTAHLFNVI